MNVFTMLKQDHKEVKDKLKTLMQAEEIDRAMAEEICQELLLHMELEEKLFYPEMEAFKEAQELSEEAQLEHKEAKKVIRELQGGKLDDVELKVKLEILQLEIEHHVKEEEQELFPKAKELLSDELIQEISEKALAMKEQKAQKALSRK